MSTTEFIVVLLAVVIPVVFAAVTVRGAILERTDAQRREAELRRIVLRQFWARRWVWRSLRTAALAVICMGQYLFPWAQHDVYWRIVLGGGACLLCGLMERRVDCATQREWDRLRGLTS